MTITQIISRIYRLTKTNSSSYDATDLLDDINIAYDRVASLIIKSDNRWQWDDTNNTDFPIATTSLVASQQDYALSTMHLKILRVEMKNASGIWSVLSPRDPQDDIGYAVSQESTITGIPTEYDKLGTSIFLYPVPNFSQVSSLKVFYQRGPASFTSTEVSTGTKSPGFNSLYHDLISLWVAYDYWMTADPGMTTRILNQITMKEAALREDYGGRDKDDKSFISMEGITHR